eukprot:gene9617-9778_t
MSIAVSYGVCAKSAQHKGGFGQALVKVWRPSDALQQLGEGVVVLATGLMAGGDGRSTMTEVAATSMLELSSGRDTSQTAINTEFDFLGVLVWVGEVIQESREHHQWVFLADDTGAAGGKDKHGRATAKHEVMQEDAPGSDQQHPASGPESAALEKQQQQEAPALLAVRLHGTPTAVNWLDPSSGLSSTSLKKLPTSAAAFSAAVGEGVQADAGVRGLKVPHLPTAVKCRLRPTLISCQHLCLGRYDAANGLWVASAADTAVVSTIKAPTSSSRWGARVKELGDWAVQQQQLLSMAEQRLQLLVNGRGSLSMAAAYALHVNLFAKSNIDVHSIVTGIELAIPCIAMEASLSLLDGSLSENHPRPANAAVTSEQLTVPSAASAIPVTAQPAGLCLVSPAAAALKNMRVAFRKAVDLVYCHNIKYSLVGTLSPGQRMLLDAAGQVGAG